MIRQLHMILGWIRKVPEGGVEYIESNQCHMIIILPFPFEILSLCHSVLRGYLRVPNLFYGCGYSSGCGNKIDRCCLLPIYSGYAIIELLYIYYI